MYDTAKQNLALRGFVHSVALAGQRKDPTSNQSARIETAMA
jgi:hypothetical protein